MPLQPGQRIGAYEVVAAIGAGGMGEVYRARDTKLHRDVALKILPEVFAFDPERLARFEREAQVLASLNHPNIAGIYGFEEGPAEAGHYVRALALELVEGPTLSERIAQGPIPIDEALPIARQIVDALEAAHEAGIIHRDLKPANIKLRLDGTVKVLDFGLAKLTQAPGSGSHGAAVTASPTITTPAMTGAGVILGTAAYMAPEQARGKIVDKRADIWAFGCVLYEMLTGSRAFDGEDVSVVMASVIKSDPEWKVLPVDTPASVRTVLRGCLQKNLRQRIRDIGDVRLTLEGGFVVSDSTTAAAAPTSIASRRALPWVAGIVAGSVMTGLAIWAVSSGENNSQPASATRFAIRLPDGELLPGTSGTLIAISPDGQTLIYRSNRNGAFRLYRRAMDQLEATPIGDENAGEAPFFSPDGQWLAFSVGTTLKKVSMLGGPSQTLVTLPMAAGPRGGAWGNDDMIILGAAVAGTAGLLRVRATGGTPELLVRPDGSRLLWYPQILPGGRAVLFTSSEARPDAGELQVFVLETGERRTLLPGSAGRVLPSGHLVFLRGGTLWAAAFDLDTLAVAGNPVPVVEGIRVEPGGAVQFAVADDGTLAYLPGSVSTSRRLFWVDRQGREEAIDAPPRRYFYPRLSPTGDRIALTVSDQDADVWVWHLTRNTLTRLTFDPAIDAAPTWTSDGKQVIFVSGREKAAIAPFRQAADGTGPAERLATDARPLDRPLLSPDGTRLLLHAVSPDTGEDIVAMSLNEDRRIEPLLNTRFIERNAELSPNGRWIAYQSNESGAFEIYVRPFPRVSEGRWQISTGGGTRPVWNRNGRELLYVTVTGTLMSVSVESESAFSFGSATRVVDLPQALSDIGRSYDVSPDGRRFLIAKDQAQQGGAQIHVVRNWFEELKRLVPIN